MRTLPTVLVVASIGALAPTAQADRCCYAMCLPRTGGTMGLPVLCQEAGTDCPRTAGNCAVFAHKDAGITCADGTGCSVGLYADVGAETLVQRLATDTDLVVTEPAVFQLRDGRALVFAPKP